MHRYVFECRHALAAAIIKEFQRDSPSIDCEPLLSDYTEIEEWIVRGRVDGGFRRCRSSRSREPSSSCATRRWLFCRKIIPSKTSKPFPSKRCAKSRFCCRKRAARQKFPVFLNTAASRLMSPSPLGATMPFSRWWKASWASACCRSWFCAASLIAPRFARFFLAYRDIVPALRSKKSVPLALKRFFDDLPFRFPAARLKGKPFISPARSSFP